MRSSDFMSFGLPGRQDPRRFIVSLGIDDNENTPLLVIPMIRYRSSSGSGSSSMMDRSSSKTSIASSNAA